MWEAMPNEFTLYCISKAKPDIIRFYDNPQEAQKALDLIRDALKTLGTDCDFDIFTVTLTKAGATPDTIRY